MAGIYIHIPFCKKACHYCNFHFSTSIAQKNGFLLALLKEIDVQKEFLRGHTVETVYFGGGTPSLLEEKEIELIMNSILKHFSLDSNPEITLEANPDDINQGKLSALKSQGINRLSIGVQSFHDADLQWMNRAHSASQAEDSIKQSQDAGFTNLTIDLIFGTPTLHDEGLLQNLSIASGLDIPHLSCYSLTVEPKTPLENRIVKKLSTAPDANDQARQFRIVMDTLTTVGYEQYEISNYARDGQYSRHNSSYWNGKLYLGLGPSAHSFNGYSRQWNVSNNALYIQSLQNGTVPAEVEVLTPVQQINERIMTSLRLKNGLSLNDSVIIRRYADALRSRSRKFMQQNLMIETGNALILTTQGKLFADGIAAELFFDLDEINENVYAGDS